MRCNEAKGPRRQYTPLRVHVPNQFVLGFFGASKCSTGLGGVYDYWVFEPLGYLIPKVIA